MMKSEYKCYFIYSRDENMNIYLQSLLQEKYDINKYYIHTATTVAECNQMQQATLYPALDGGYWLSVVQADKLMKDDIVKLIQKQNYSEILVVITDNYAVYKNVMKDSGYQKCDVCEVYAGRLDILDMAYLEKKILGKRDLPDKTIRTVYSMYRLMPYKVVQFFTYIQQGLILETQSQIVEYLGLGRINTADVVMHLLCKLPDKYTAKKVQNYVHKYLQFIQLLTQDDKLQPTQIYKYMRTITQCLTDMKLLLLQGVSLQDYCRGHKDEPLAKRIATYMKYEETLKMNISLENLITLQTVLQRYGGADYITESVLLNIVFDYMKAF